MIVFARLLKYLLRYRVHLIDALVCSALGERGTSQRAAEAILAECMT